MRATSNEKARGTSRPSGSPTPCTTGWRSWGGPGGAGAGRTRPLPSPRWAGETDPRRRADPAAGPLQLAGLRVRGHAVGDLDLEPGQGGQPGAPQAPPEEPVELLPADVPARGARGAEPPHRASGVLAAHQTGGCSTRCGRSTNSPPPAGAGLLAATEQPAGHGQDQRGGTRTRRTSLGDVSA